MGMYTEFCLGLQFKKDTPEEVVAALAFMATGEGEPPQLGHKLFKSERWERMLRSGGSAYFVHQPCRVWVKKYDKWHLTVWTNIKNYDSEIELFLDWITPHVESYEGEVVYLGFKRYEVYDTPTLLYLIDGEIIEQSVPVPEKDSPTVIETTARKSPLELSHA